MKTLLYILLSFFLFLGCSTPLSPPKVAMESHNALVQASLKHLGKPYLYGGIGPDRFDGSGLVYVVAKETGVTLPRTAYAQSHIKGERLSREALQVGDLLFFDTTLQGRVNHVGIYLGEDKFIHASSTEPKGVIISSLDGDYKDKFQWGKRVVVP